MFFTPEDFKLPMETSLRLRVINDEIEGCNNADLLKEHLKDCVRMTMQYQHMLEKVIERTIVKDLDDWINKVEAAS
tara:strand:+ start:18854 stop:19081 length:228 start_codon:yes stop_codon:yes gene_type:complete